MKEPRKNDLEKHTTGTMAEKRNEDLEREVSRNKTPNDLEVLSIAELYRFCQVLEKILESLGFFYA